MQKRTKGFLKLLQRYIDNTSSSEEKKVMDYWYNSIDQEIPEDQNNMSRQKLEEKMWTKIQKETHNRSSFPVQQQRKWWESNLLKFASAASVLFVLGFIYYFSDYRKISSFPIKGISAATLAALSKFENNTSGNKVVRLLDGSHITLEPGSSLYFPKPFDSDKRNVYLVGNGFFNITKNPAKPFFVYSEDIVTKVVGTSFTIRKNSRSGDMEVAVLTGKVIVEKSGNNKSGFDVNGSGIILTPNKKVTYLHDTEKYVTGIVETPVLVQGSGEFQKPGAFTFEETSLSEVIEKLEKAYGVDIKITNESILNCPITADLPKESLFTKLEIINALLNTKSEVEGTTIILTGGECTPFKSVHPNP